MLEEIIATRIKELRVRRGLTLEEVAQKTAFTKSLISKVENNKVSPPIATLLKIAEALDVDISFFFKPEQKESVLVVKKGEGEPIIRKYNKLEQRYVPLTLGHKHRKMEGFIVTVKVDKSSSDTRSLDRHEGEELVFILKGKTNFVCGHKKYTVEESDSLYFDAKLPHGVELIHGESMTYLDIFTRD